MSNKILNTPICSGYSDPSIQNNKLDINNIIEKQMEEREDGK